MWLLNLCFSAVFCIFSARQITRMPQYSCKVIIFLYTKADSQIKFLSKHVIDNVSKSRDWGGKIQ